VSDTALYLYCIIPASDPLPALAAPALDGGHVHAVHCQELAVLAHACAPEPYQGSEEQVRGWIAAHNAVVEEAWESAHSVLPMSFDVIVTGDDGRSAEANLVGWLADHYRGLRERLRVLSGRAEVGVQILWDLEALAGAPVTGSPGREPRARGHAFFAEQQQRRQLRERLARKADADSNRYFGHITALADDVQVNEPRQIKGHRPRQMILNLSLLLTRDSIPRLGDYLETVSREQAVEVRFTGPWPPYSFTGAFGSVEYNGDNGARWLKGQREVDRRGAMNADCEESGRPGDAPRTGREVSSQP
jgi:Gas vesicle synthesis protein GvpL/GvpF